MREIKKQMQMQEVPQQGSKSMKELERVTSQHNQEYKKTVVPLFEQALIIYDSGDKKGALDLYNEVLQVDYPKSLLEYNDKIRQIGGNDYITDYTICKLISRNLKYVEYLRDSRHELIDVDAEFKNVRERLEKRSYDSNFLYELNKERKASFDLGGEKCKELFLKECLDELANNSLPVKDNGPSNLPYNLERVNSGLVK